MILKTFYSDQTMAKRPQNRQIIGIIFLLSEFDVKCIVGQ